MFVPLTYWQKVYASNNFELKKSHCWKTCKSWNEHFSQIWPIAKLNDWVVKSLFIKYLINISSTFTKIQGQLIVWRHPGFIINVTDRKTTCHLRLGNPLEMILSPEEYLPFFNRSSISFFDNCLLLISLPPWEVFMLWSIALSNPSFNDALSNISLSYVFLHSNLYTFTIFCCPIRWHLAWAWKYTLWRLSALGVLKL